MRRKERERERGGAAVMLPRRAACCACCAVRWPPTKPPHRSPLTHPETTRPPPRTQRAHDSFSPYAACKCLVCKQQLHQTAQYCQTCAFKRGLCAMCGKQMLDVSKYKQTNK